MPDSSATADAAPLGALVAVGADGFNALIDDGAHALLPLAGPAVIERQMARLVDAGVQAVHVILLESPDTVASRLGDRGRWGVPVVYHLVRDRLRPLRILDRIDHDGDWLAVDCRCVTPLPTEPAIMLDRERRVTGTARGNRTALRSLVVGRRHRDVVGGQLIDAGWLDTPSTLLQTTRTLLDAESAAAAFGISVFECFGEQSGDDCQNQTRPVERVLVGRNVRLHPRAELIEPVVIGPDCDIGADACIGPHVVLGAGCVLDDGAELRDAIVAGRTYVGTGLDVEQSIVSGDRLAHARLGTTLTIQDRSLIDAIVPAGQREIFRTATLYLIGLLLWRLTRPLAVLVWPLRRWAETQPPASRLRHLMCQFLPGLTDVVRGRRRLVGSSGQVNTIWRGPTAAAGLISEAIVRHSPSTPLLETTVADAYYAATASLRRDLRLLAGYFRRVGSV